MLPPGSGTKLASALASSWSDGMLREAGVEPWCPRLQKPMLLVLREGPASSSVLASFCHVFKPVLGVAPPLPSATLWPWPSPRAWPVGPNSNDRNALPAATDDDDDALLSQSLPAPPSATGGSRSLGIDCSWLPREVQKLDHFTQPSVPRAKSRKS